MTLRAASRWVGISSDSMRPALLSGDVVEVIPRGAEELKRGAIVVLDRNGQWVCHRFIRSRGGFLFTQGDNLWHADTPAPENALLGEAVALLRPGEKPRRIDGPASRWGGTLRIFCRKLLWRADHLRRKVTI